MSRRYEWEREVAVEAVREAARLCRAVRAEISPEVLAKKDRSPVTVADFGSQALIARALAEAFPDDPVIAEEDSAELRLPENAPLLDQVLRHVRAVRGGGDSAGALDAGEVCRWIDRGGASEYRDRFWTLDPIDGTKGFLRGEQYAVALAMVVERPGRRRGPGMSRPGRRLLRRPRRGGIRRTDRSGGRRRGRAAGARARQRPR